MARCQPHVIKEIAESTTIMGLTIDEIVRETKIKKSLIVKWIMTLYSCSTVVVDSYPCDLEYNIEKLIVCPISSTSKTSILTLLHVNY